MESNIVDMWVVRHGQTVDNVNGIYQGQTEGKLTETGISQAIRVGQRLASERFDRVYVSDLGRTRETLKGIEEGRGGAIEPPAEFTRLLREKSGGIFEGGPSRLLHLAQQESGISMREFVPEKGESMNDIQRRVVQHVRQVFFDCVVSESDNGRMV